MFKWPKKVKQIVLFLSVFCFCISCEENESIISAYLGEYEFIITDSSNIMGDHSESNPIVFVGSISKYKSSDAEIDLYYGDDSDLQELNHRKLTIHFSEGMFLTTEIDRSGKFKPRSSYFRSQSGEFVNEDSVHFTVGGRSRTLGSWQSFVVGKRLN